MAFNMVRLNFSLYNAIRSQNNASELPEKQGKYRLNTVEPLLFLSYVYSSPLKFSKAKIIDIVVTQSVNNAGI